MQDFRRLGVWTKTHELVLETYRVTRTFPKEELFGLTSQLRRSVSSIGANIAEGCGRTQPEFVHYLQVAFGSASEAEYHLLLAKDLTYLEVNAYAKLAAQLQENQTDAELAVKESTTGCRTFKAAKLVEAWAKEN
jgi:four helix bundle protein